MMTIATHTPIRAGARCRKRWWLALTVLALAGCGQVAGPEGDGAIISGPAKRVVNAEQVAQGAALYTAHCAVCHGDKAQGTENWRRTGPDGKYPPPPLNGTGHAWHHPTEVLLEVILDGSMGDGNMPAWRGKLSESQSRAIVAWLQTLWSDEVYAVWYEIESQARGENR